MRNKPRRPTSPFPYLPGAIWDVRVVSPGAIDYDSGLGPVADGVPAAITTTSTYVFVVLVANKTDQIQAITLTDGLGEVYMNARVLQPNETIVEPFGGVLAAGGLKAGATGTGSLNIQIRGRQ